MAGFFSFHRLVSTDIIKAIYGVGAILITFFGLVLIVGSAIVLSGNDFRDEAMQRIFMAGDPGLKMLVGWFVLIFGNLFWRLMCEAWILFFSIHEILAEIRNELKNHP